MKAKKPTTEQLKTIIDFPDYMISNHGYVLSTKQGKPRKLKMQSDGQGYLWCNICDRGVIKPIRIHRYVAKYFLPEIPPDFVVHHIDGDRINNHIDNLAVVTQRQNVLEAIKNHFKTPMSKSCGYNKGRKIIITDDRGTQFEIKSMYRAAKILGVTIAAVYNACTGRQARVKGYNVKYA